VESLSPEREEDVIRIIVKQIDSTVVAVGVSDEAREEFKTFDVELPEVEQWLRENTDYVHRSFIGIELK
jgi:hypothetical protein